MNALTRAIHANERVLARATIHCPGCEIDYPFNAHAKFTDGKCPFCAKGRKQAWVLGVGSLCADGTHALFWDFDNVPAERVRDALRQVQLTFTLGDIHVLRSSPGDNYQAVCFDKFPRWRAQEILRQTADVDQSYSEVFRYRKHATLRFSAKRNGVAIQYAFTIESARVVREQSAPLWRFYAALIPQIEAYPLARPDAWRALYLEGYRSRHVGEQHEGVTYGQDRPPEVREVSRQISPLPLLPSRLRILSPLPVLHSPIQTGGKTQ